MVLIGWLIFFRYMVYIALRYKTAAPEAKQALVASAYLDKRQITSSGM